MFLNKTKQGQSKWNLTANHGYTDVVISPTAGVNPGDPAVYGSNRKTYDMIDIPQNGTSLQTPLILTVFSDQGMSEYGNRGKIDIVNWFGGGQTAVTPGSGTPSAEVTQTSSWVLGLPYTTATFTEQGSVQVGNIHNPMHSTNPTSVYGNRHALYAPTADRRDYAHFGASVAIGMNKIFVGAPGANPTTAVNYSGTDPLPSTVRWSNGNATGAAQGCVYVYNYKGEYLHQFDVGTYEAAEFGACVAVSPGSVWIGSPGNPSTIGAAYYERYASGRVVVYDYDIDNDYETPDGGTVLRPGTYSTWDYQLNQPGDRFGEVIKIIGDRAYISAPGTNEGIGTVYIFNTEDRKYIGEMGPPLDAVRDSTTGDAKTFGFGTWIEGDGTHIFVGSKYSTDGTGRVFVYDSASGIFLKTIGYYGDSDAGTYPSFGRSSDHYFRVRGGLWDTATMNFSSINGISGPTVDSTNTRHIAQNCSNGNFVIMGYQDNTTGYEKYAIYRNSRTLRPRDALTLDGANRWRKYNQSIQDNDWQQRLNIGG